MNFENIFPVLNKFTYLNTAYSGLLSTTTAEWRRCHDDKFVNGGSNFRAENSFIFKELKNNLSEFFDTQKEQIYLVPNFSFGFNTLIERLSNKHRFLLLKEDYPNINYAVNSKGFSFCEVEIDDNLESKIIEAIQKFKPTVFAFSMVQYISGLSINLAFIKKLKTTYPDLLIVADGTQFSGTVKFSFENSGLDALLGSGYKWLLGGYGNGYVLLSNQIIEELYLKQPKTDKSRLQNRSGSNDLSLYFEPGHLDTLNFGTLNEGIKFIKTIGIDFIEKQTQELAQQARIEFYSRGLLKENELNRKTQSTIINLPIKGLNEKLEAEKILCSPRGNGLRFAFHFYNTTQDLNKLLKVIDANI